MLEEARARGEEFEWAWERAVASLPRGRRVFPAEGGLRRLAVGVNEAGQALL